jgi:hypothetical protein
MLVFVGFFAIIWSYDMMRFKPRQRCHGLHHIGIALF